MLLSVFITVAFVIGEAVAGFFSNSLALLSDAGHKFADALALVLSWYSLWIAQRPSSAKRTFGYHRVGILVALVCCSCHVSVEEQSVRSGQNVLRNVAEKLEQTFGIRHSTIQVEVEGCDPNDMYCVMKIAKRHEAHDHRH